MRVNGPNVDQPRSAAWDVTLSRHPAVDCGRTMQDTDFMVSPGL
jgi:hypothetical protein